ncbi:DNA-directed RNA polymerase II subunit rpb1 [Pleurotus pulmonarius]|nr:DNA-directed RNA polymerase II subunit rpb1 [Pleurotus pulmonarius]
MEYAVHGGKKGHFKALVTLLARQFASNVDKFKICEPSCELFHRSRGEAAGTASLLSRLRCADGTSVCLVCKSGFTQDANDRTKGTPVPTSKSSGTICPQGTQLREWCDMPPPARRPGVDGEQAPVHGVHTRFIPLERAVRRRVSRWDGCLVARQFQLHSMRLVLLVPVTSSSASPARTTGSPPQTANPCNPLIANGRCRPTCAKAQFLDPTPVAHDALTSKQMRVYITGGRVALREGVVPPSPGAGCGGGASGARFCVGAARRLRRHGAMSCATCPASSHGAVGGGGGWKWWPFCSCDGKSLQPDKRLITPSEVYTTFKKMTDSSLHIIGLSDEYSRPDWMILTGMPVPPPREQEGPPAHVISEFEQLLQFHVATYMDNDIAGIPQALQKSGRPRLRGNLMGKRADFWARNVITGDPNLELDEGACRITLYNISYLQELVRNRPTTYPGARCVLLNRQPSLHKMSMMSHRVKLMPYSNSSQPSLPSQSEETRAEPSQIAWVPRQIVSPQANKPVMQDTLCGIRKLTLRDTFMDLHAVQNILLWVPDWDGIVPIPTIIKPKPMWTGKQILSLAIPRGINIFRAAEPKSPNPVFDDGMCIENWEIIWGIVEKKTVGASQGGLVHVVFRKKGPEGARALFSGLQKAVNHWLFHNGFSIGIGDTIADAKTIAFITQTIAGHKAEVAAIAERATIDELKAAPGMTIRESFESQVERQLNLARDTSGQYAQKNLKEDNNMVVAGSKGSFISILQMSVCVGQLGV